MVPLENHPLIAWTEKKFNELITETINWKRLFFLRDPILIAWSEFQGPILGCDETNQACNKSFKPWKQRFVCVKLEKIGRIEKSFELFCKCQ